MGSDLLYRHSTANQWLHVQCDAQPLLQMLSAMLESGIRCKARGSAADEVACKAPG